MMQMKALVCACALVLVVPQALAQKVGTTQTQSTQTGNSVQNSTADDATRLTSADILSARIWGLSNTEMVRAKVLLQGPRAAFSVANISPIEALGIHARNEAERRKYAEMFARAMRADVERSLAWDREVSATMARLYPNDPVVSFAGQPKVAASAGMADAANIPRSLLAPAPRK